ncbi:MAG: MBL fold metallo-hydrolase [Desulfovibrio sp.]|uniref:MBL fold metallo-hydrolase n=1 Tax=Desulfovibrio sp. 7SRBS1 TaxID=3378064 RepID=UPI003B3E095D
MRYAVLFIVLLVLALVFLGWVYLQQDKFGRLPSGERLARIRQSSNYGDGIFHNRTPISRVLEGGFVGNVVRFLFRSKENIAPPYPMPTVKTDLQALDRNRDVVVWLGHSSYYMQLDGKTLLIDPVFSAYASPVFFSTRAFEGTNIYSADDMPHIDYLLISHDHWDHLDYQTVMDLKPKIGAVVTGLGVGEHFARWGFPETMIHEGDWGSALRMDNGFVIHILPARHFSGRLLDRNKTLWAAFAVESSKRRIFYSGDSGYGPHFKAIGRTFGGFDLALMDSGQYNEAWADVHMTPEQAAQAAEDMKAAGALPSHTGKFSISFHSWDDPFRRFAAASQDKSYRLVTPEIGRPVDLEDFDQPFFHWWEQ